MPPDAGAYESFCWSRLVSAAAWLERTNDPRDAEDARVLRALVQRGRVRVLAPARHRGGTGHPKPKEKP
ncbi:MAG TPA: hypothetical protein VG370_34945 [Chloroflexota bacterium]|jgi:hypothetical protein|nr:hypothetical protein [Chloroflexota bacterium]